MFEKENNPEFVNNLLAQDPPPADILQRYKEALLKEIEHRMRLQKAVIIAIYTALFLAAFGAFMLRQYTDNVIHSICWGSVSLHILLWFLIYFLRGIYRLTAEIVEKSSSKDEQHKWKNQDRLVTIVAILTFTFATVILYHSFFLKDPLRAARLSGGIFWATIFFLFWYPFGTASLLAKLWLEYKKMELNIPKTKEQNLKSHSE